MTTEGSEDVANQMLKDLQSWWEIPSMAQYISLFRESFHLPEIEIEELEKGFIDDTIKGPSTWLQNLIIAFLKSIMPGRGVNAENWELNLRKLIKRKWPVEEQNPFDEDCTFQQLKLRSKVVIVYSLCLYRLDRNDIADLMKSMDAEALRVQKLGVDDLGNTYWYFYGTRLYKEEVEEKKSWDEEWKAQKKKSFRKRRRGRPRKRVPTSDGESDFEDFDTSKDDRYMNVNEKSRWSVVCDTIEEWVNFAEKFKNSKSKNEMSLFKIIQENFLPTLNKIYEEKEKKLQEKIKQLMPVREKIVTRRETRRLRGEDVDRSPVVNGYGSDDSYKYYYPVKDRAQRLEERNKRASEAENLQLVANKRTKKSESRFSDENEQDSSVHKGSDNTADDIQSQMEKLVSSVKLHKDAWPFLYPVNEEDAPGYYEIIKDPIDLSTIERRLLEGEYETVGDLDADFSKMVSNCELYNGEYHAFSKMAQVLRIVFRKGVSKILDSLQPSESKSTDSEGSSDSQYHSSSNSGEVPVETSNIHKKPKERKKKRKRSSEALDLLAQASEIAVQENLGNRISPVEKKSPVPQQTEITPHVPSTNIPCSSSSISTNISETLSVSSSNCIPTNSFTKHGNQRERPVIIKAKVSEKTKLPNTNVVTTSHNVVFSTHSNNTAPQNSIQQRQSNSKTVPVMFTYNNSSPSTQNDLRLENNQSSVITVQSNMQPNMCISNNLPVVQQMLIPAGSRAIQMQNNGQLVFASPQNSMRLFNKEQNVQVLNSAGQINQGYAKVVPQFLTSAPVLQVSKDVMQNFQFQTVSQNNTQAFTQVTQSPQCVNIPTYILTNPNAISNSSSHSVMNLQPFQLSQRQMHIGGQGNA